MRKLLPLVLALSSASTFASDNIDISKGVELLDVSKGNYTATVDDSVDRNAENIEELKPILHEEKSPLIYDKNTESSSIYDQPTFAKDSYIAIGYVYPMGVDNYADEYSPSFTIKAGVTIHDVEIKGHYLSSGYKFDGQNSDINEFGFGVNKGFLTTDQFRLYLGAGYDHISIDNISGRLVDNGVVVSSGELKAHTFYGTIGAEFAATDSLNVNAFARYNFGHDYASISFNDKVMKVYEDLGFGIGAQYDLNENLAFGLSHVRGSDLLEMTQIEAKYKF